MQNIESKYFTINHNNEFSPYQIEFEEQKVCQIKREKGSYQFFFSFPFRILSPTIAGTSLEMNYQFIPFNCQSMIEYHFLIIQCQKIYLLIKNKNQTNCTIDLLSSTQNKLVIKSNYLSDLCFQIDVVQNRPRLLKHHWLPRIQNDLPIVKNGVFFQADHFKSSISEICNHFDLKETIAITEFQNPYDQKMQIQLESFIQILKMSGFSHLPTYDLTMGTENKNTDLNQKVLNRNHSPLSLNDRYYINPFSEKGENLLFAICEDKVSHQAEGIFFKPVFFQFHTETQYQTAICKTRSAYLSYGECLKRYQEILQKIIGLWPEKLFLLELLSPKTEIAYFPIPTASLKNHPINFIESLHFQGYYYLCLIIDKEGLAISQDTIIQYLAAQFLTPMTFYHFSFLEDMKKKGMEDWINQAITLKKEISILLYNSIIKKEIMIQRDRTNKPTGIQFGNSAYLSFPASGLFQNHPGLLINEKWYCWQKKQIITIQQQDKKEKAFQLYIRKNSIIPILTRDFSGGMEYLKFIIYVHSDCQFTYQEIVNQEGKRTKWISHHLSIQYISNTIAIQYQSEQEIPIDRHIIFHIVTDDQKIDKANLNNKEIKILHNKTQSFAEIKVSTKKIPLTLQLDIK
ncbi:MAG: hypothetical protein MJB14_20365 [Spirochaetes bacterium]|nr:hypothetical protein [Spirochaetota bacterium]